jgi:phosphatidyl-myo-inositol dimannoside synthase
VRLLYLATDAYGRSGGIALYNRDMIAALAAADGVREIVVVARHTAPADLPPKVRQAHSHSLDKPAWTRAAFAEATRPIDVVICGHLNLLPVATVIARLRRARLVTIVHGIEAWDRHPSLLVRLALGQSDRLWAVSTVTRDRLCAWSGLSADRFVRLPGAVRPERFGMAPRRRELGERYGIEGRRVLLTLARLAASERYKGVDEVLEVLPQLIVDDASLLYLVAGDGDDRGRLERKAADLGLAAHVRFIGFIDEKDKADLYRLADAFVMPGRGEGLGLVYLEALACGTPAVGSRIDGSREALRDGELGELADPDQPQEIVDAIRRALARPRAVPAGLAHFGWPSFAARAAAAVAALVVHEARVP